MYDYRPIGVRQRSVAYGSAQRHIVVSSAIPVRQRVTGNLAETDARLEPPDQRERPEAEVQDGLDIVPTRLGSPAAIVPLDVYVSNP